jgi:hypothetical protein
MSYREADALRVLHATIDKLAPKRPTASDGWIGDAAHASRDSDHNPWVHDAHGVGVVRARDVTVTPPGSPHTAASWVDGPTLAQSLADLLGKHPAMGAGAYVIHNRRIISTNRHGEGWRPYTGSNAHTKHVHVSVGLAGYDSRTPWPVKVQPAAKLNDVAKARVLLRAALARAVKAGNPRRAGRLRGALTQAPPT